jgi:hypothetical protein
VRDEKCLSKKSSESGATSGVAAAASGTVIEAAGSAPAAALSSSPPDEMSSSGVRIGWGHVGTDGGCGKGDRRCRKEQQEGVSESDNW